MSKKRSRKFGRVFVETSVFIRFLTNDDPKKAADCRALFEMIESGTIKPFISNIVILEIIFVLTRLYHFPRGHVVQAAQKILEMRNLVLIEKSDTRRALECWNTGKAQYGDCLIASQVPHGVPIVTYDADFQRFPKLKVINPAEAVSA